MLKIGKEFKGNATNLGILYWLTQKVAPKFWALVASMGGLYFMTVLFAMHFLRNDLDPLGDPVSYYRLTDSSNFPAVGFCKRLCPVFSSATLTLFSLMVIAFEGNSVLHPYFGLLEKITIIVMMTWSWVVMHKIYRCSKNIGVFNPRKLMAHEPTC